MRPAAWDERGERVAGTDHGGEGGPEIGSETRAESPRGPTFILVAPQMGENIGAAARAMWNFGLDRMRLVAPRDGWPNPRAVAMASGAAHVLDRVTVHDSVLDAGADLGFVFATTARDRSLTKQVMTPEQAMAEARAMIAAGERVGILFGPERAGLENADIVRANAVISVPVNPAFGSLNLGQSALLIAYEWMRQVDATPPATYVLAGAERATGIEVEKFMEHLVARLDAAGFFFPEHKRPHMVGNLENLFRRAPLTDADIRTLHGVVRALAVKRPGRK
ncbi:RNA methyltransferase [uncultured Amaricoccus sp.]|uniref:RNA methyltransferase n=1 Tax=uncultured Amaricoccus sp. TaxID=339341 RepID=UPI0026253A28|nr:RNA methyltransferase [uncultured Amaricoccus sp.]